MKSLRIFGIVFFAILLTISLSANANAQVRSTPVAIVPGAFYSDTQVLAGTINNDRVIALFPARATNLRNVLFTASCVMPVAKKPRVQLFLGSATIPVTMTVQFDNTVEATYVGSIQTTGVIPAAQVVEVVMDWNAAGVSTFSPACQVSLFAETSP
jgi:hypothetical protein